jgi:hypothetical protein
MAPGKVFSLQTNRIHRLPAYLSQFQNLTLLRVDKNPIEWPPKNVIEAPHVEAADAMKNWIRSVQKWIEQNSIISDHKHNDELIQQEQSFSSNNSDPFLCVLLQPYFDLSLKS